MITDKILKQKYTILGIFLSMIFLFLAFRKVDLSTLGTKIKSADLNYILISLLPLCGSYITRTFLWQRIVSTRKNVDFSNAFSALMIGLFGNNVLPGRAGEFIRAYVIGNKEKIGKAFIFGTIVVERLFDVFTLFLLLVFSASMFSMPQWAIHIGETTSVILLVLLVLTYLVIQKKSQLFARVKNKFSFLSSPKGRFVIAKLDSFISGLRVLKNPKLIVTVFILSLLSWLFAAMSMFFVLKSIDIDIPSYGLFFITSVINLGVIIPSSPGYIGTYQFLCVIALSAFSVDKETALSFSIIQHALWYLPLTLIGLVFLWRENLNLAKLRTMKEAVQK